MVPVFPLGHPLGGGDLPPGGSPGYYTIDAALGVPGVSRSAFEVLNWDTIVAEADSLIEVPGQVSSIIQSSHRGGLEGEEVISFEFSLNAHRRLATASTRLEAHGFPNALANAQDVLESYLSVMSFYQDVPAEAVAWWVTEERTGAVRFSMKFLGMVKPLGGSLGALSTPELRELFSTWREAMNASTPMWQALGFYKIIERVHKYRIARAARTRGTDNEYQAPRERIPDTVEGLSAIPLS